MRTILRRLAVAERAASAKLMELVIEDLELNGRLVDIDFITIEVSYWLDYLATVTEKVAGPVVPSVT